MPSLQLPQFTGAITISPLLPLILFGLVISGVLVLTFFLNYNWKHYGVNAIQVMKIRFWYFTGFGILSAAMLFSALGYLVL